MMYQFLLRKLPYNIGHFQQLLLQLLILIIQRKFLHSFILMCLQKLVLMLLLMIAKLLKLGKVPNNKIVI